MGKTPQSPRPPRRRGSLYEAVRKRIQRAKVVEEHGSKELTRRRRVEKQRQRLRDTFPFRSACGCSIRTFSERGWSRGKRFAWFRRSGISVSAAPQVPLSASLEAVRLARFAIPIQSFSLEAQRAYAELLTVFAWSSAGWLKEDGERRLAKWLRGALHGAVARLGGDPLSLLRQLAHIGAALVEGCPCCLKGGERAPFVDRLGAALPLLALYFHLRDSRIDLVELEVDILQQLDADDPAEDGEDQTEDDEIATDEDSDEEMRFFFDVVTGRYWEFFRELEPGFARIVAEEEGVGGDSQRTVDVAPLEHMEEPWCSTR